MEPTFHCLIATIGRPSLQVMLDSLLPQLSEMDCLTVVFDGFSEIPSIFDFTSAKCPVVLYCEPTALGFYGHGIRNKYAGLLETRDFVMHADDDDIYTLGTFDYLREHCLSNDTIYIGKMQCIDGRIVGVKIELGYIGTPCGIIPFSYNKTAIWQLHHGGDGRFYEELQSKYPDKIVFLDRLIYIVKLLSGSQI